MTWTSPLGGGNPSAFTCSVFRLDALGQIPIEPLFDLIPGLTKMRVTFDMIDSEAISFEYATTDHPVQGGDPLTSNIREQLEKVTITGTLAAQVQPLRTPFVPGIPGPQATPPLLPGVEFQPSLPPMPPAIVRLDMLRLENLRSIAKAKRPVMMVTPRITLPRAAMLSVQSNWTPDMGESLQVTCSFQEFRVVSPLAVDSVIDFGSMTPGNNIATGGGSPATAASGTVTPSATQGVAPFVGASAGAP